MTRRVVVVGTGVAGVAATRRLRGRGYDGQLTMVGAEPDPPYDRPALSKEYLTGELDADDLALITTAELDELDVELITDSPVTALDPTARLLHTATGALGFTDLVLAPGAAPRRLRGTVGPGVHQLRSLADARSLRAALSTASSVVMVGAGFIGCEIASSAATLGLDVTVVEAAPTLLAGAVPAAVGAAVLRDHRDAGVRFVFGAEVRAVGAHRVELADGVVHEADVVVAAVGSEPATAWLGSAGLTGSGGAIVVDAYLATRWPGIHAAGDAAGVPDARSGRRVRAEHWTTARAHGELAADNLLDPGARRVPGDVGYVWSDQHGRRLQICGDVRGGRTVPVEGTPADDGFVVAVTDGATVLGAVGYARPRAFRDVRRLVEAGAGVAALHERWPAA